MPVSRRSRQIERAQQTGRPLGFTDRVSKVAFWKEWLSDDEIKDLRTEFGDILRHRPNAIAAIKSVPRMNEWLRNTYPKVHAEPEQPLKPPRQEPSRVGRRAREREKAARLEQATSTRRIQAAAAAAETAEEADDSTVLTWDDIGSQISSEPIVETVRQRRERNLLRPGGPNFSDKVSKIAFWKDDMGLSKEEIKDLRSRFGDILRSKSSALAAIRSVPRMNEWLRNTYPKLYDGPEQATQAEPTADMLLTWDDIGSTIEDSAFSSQTQPIAPLPSVSRTETTAQRRGLVTSPPLTDYELMRQANIEENKRKLAELEAELRRQENTEENMRRLAELDVPTPPPMAGTGSRSISDLTGLEQFLGSLDNIMDSLIDDE